MNIPRFNQATGIAFRARIDKLDITHPNIDGRPSLDDFTDIDNRLKKYKGSYGTSATAVTDGDGVLKETFKIGDPVLIKYDKKEFTGKIEAMGKGWAGIADSCNEIIIRNSKGRLKVFKYAEIFSEKGLNKLIKSATKGLEALEKFKKGL